MRGGWREAVGVELSVTKEIWALNYFCDASCPFYYHIWVSLARTNKCAQIGYNYCSFICKAL
jgi:hypothetical protein